MHWFSLFSHVSQFNKYSGVKNIIIPKAFAKLVVSDWSEYIISPSDSELITSTIFVKVFADLVDFDDLDDSDDNDDRHNHDEYYGYGNDADEEANLS